MKVRKKLISKTKSRRSDVIKVGKICLLDTMNNQDKYCIHNCYIRFLKTIKILEV